MYTKSQNLQLYSQKYNVNLYNSKMQEAKGHKNTKFNYLTLKTNSNIGITFNVPQYRFFTTLMP
jgi:hypothetical protein